MRYDDTLKWEKYRDLRKAYKNCLRQGWFTASRRAFAVAVKQPYPSFYITAEYCVKMFRWIESGNPRLEAIRPLTRKKLDHLYARYLELHEQEPNEPKIAICDRIVNEQAPELYMTGDSAYNFYIDMRKKKRLLDKLNENTNTQQTTI